MILTGQAIHHEYAEGRIRISDFDPDCISTNSYDLRLGDRIVKYREDVLDPRRENAYDEIVIAESGYRLEAGEFVLGHSREAVGSDYFVPIIHAKSGTARLGLFMHVTADLIDIGSYGTVTFQMFATTSVMLWPGCRIA